MHASEKEQMKSCKESMHNREIRKINKLRTFVLKHDMPDFIPYVYTL